MEVDWSNLSRLIQMMGKWPVSSIPSCRVLLTSQCQANPARIQYGSPIIFSAIILVIQVDLMSHVCLNGAQNELCIFLDNIGHNRGGSGVFKICDGIHTTINQMLPEE
jgi:hypothetical protein